MPQAVYKYIFSLLLIFIGSNQLLYAQNYWGEWQKTNSASSITAKSYVEVGQIENGYSTYYAVRCNRPYVEKSLVNSGSYNISLPYQITTTPLKPFQFRVDAMPANINGGYCTWRISFEVTTSMGAKSYDITQSCGFNAEYGRDYWLILENGIFKKNYSDNMGIQNIIMDYNVDGTLTIGKGIWEIERILYQFHNVKSITRINVALSGAGVLRFNDSFFYRTMNTDGMIESALRSARYALSQGNSDEAIRVLSKIIDDYRITYNSEAYLLRGSAYAEKGMFTQAVYEASRAITQSSGNSEDAYYLKGRCLLEQGDFSGINDLRKGGYKGQAYLQEHGLTDAEYQPSTSGTHKSLDSATKTKITTTKKTVKLSAKQIYNKYNPAVFMIYTRGIDGEAQGSGFFVNSNGLAISNFHVFEGAIKGKEQIKLTNGGSYKVKEILAYDKDKDYIIFMVEGTGFSYIPVTKRGYEIGDEVYAIGSPRGMQNTLSNGLVSQKWDDSRFQISVPIDHGSSGGALINQYGEVIGITSGGRDDSHANLNYAVDIRTIFSE